jgi:hypothetical protein
MATLTRDVERPAFLDRPSEEQLSFGGGVTAPARGREAGRGDGARVPLSERLRAERDTAGGVGSGASRARTTRGGGATLDDVLVGAWEGLSARRPVACPVCAGPMQPGAVAAGGACGDCGSQLR